MCWEANSKKYTIQPDVLIALESSPPYFVVLKHSSRFARCRFLHGSIFLSLICSTTLVALLVVDLSVSILNLALFCSIRQLALLVVDLSLSQSFFICFSEPLLLDSLCPLWRRFSQLSKYPYFHQTGSCKLLSSLAIFLLFIFYSHKFFSIFTIFSSIWNRFLCCCFLYSSVLYQRPVIWRIKKFTPVVLAPWLQFILKPDWSNVLRPSYCEDVSNLDQINFLDFLAIF